MKAFLRLLGIARGFEKLRKKAGEGDAEAQNTLRAMDDQGEGLPKDGVDVLITWFRKAADQGDTTAQSILRVKYATGDGVPKDDVEACKWFSLAAGTGLAAAADRRRRLESRMTAAQIAEAARRCREFTPRKTTPSNDDARNAGGGKPEG